MKNASKLLRNVLLCACASIALAHASVRVVAFGDSLMAGYQLSIETGFTAQLQAFLNKQGIDAEVVNLSISGNTTTDGRNRLRHLLRTKPDLVLVGLGSNDALRNQPPQLTYENIRVIVNTLQRAEIPMLLLGAQAPYNWGLKYKQEFDRIFPQLADEHDLPLYPFILEGVALDPSYILADGLHPNATGVELMIQGIGPQVIKILERLSN